MMDAAVSHVWTCLVSTRLDTPHTCFHLRLFLSHSRTWSHSFVPGAVVVATAPLTSCQGHFQVGTVAAAQLHVLVTCPPQQTLISNYRSWGVSHQGHHLADESKPGRVWHVSMPEPQVKQAYRSELAATGCVWWQCWLSHGVIYFSRRDTGHGAHPTPDVSGEKVLTKMGVGCTG